MKLTLEYDSMTGNLYDNGILVATIPTNMTFSDNAKKEQSSTKDLVSLKGTGFTADEIMQMKREGLV